MLSWLFPPKKQLSKSASTVPERYMPWWLSPVLVTANVESFARTMQPLSLVPPATSKRMAFPALAHPFVRATVG